MRALIKQKLKEVAERYPARMAAKQKRREYRLWLKETKPARDAASAEKQAEEARLDQEAARQYLRGSQHS